MKANPSLEALMQAAMSAPPERREEAFRLLHGEHARTEPYLTMRELSRRLGFAESTLRRWRVPGHDLGGVQRYRWSEVDAYLRTEAHLRRQSALRAQRKLSAQGAQKHPKPINNNKTQTKGA